MIERHLHVWNMRRKWGIFAQLRSCRRAGRGFSDTRQLCKGGKAGGRASYARWPNFRPHNIKRLGLQIANLSTNKSYDVQTFFVDRPPSPFICQSGRSTKKFCKTQILKFADFNNLLELRIFLYCASFKICDLRTQSFLWFAVLKLLKVRKYRLLLRTIIAYNDRIVGAWTRATYILCIELQIMLRLRRESNPGPPALQADTLCTEPFERISCNSGSHLVLLQNSNLYILKIV